MIKHIVMWKLKDSHEGMSKDECIAKIKQELEGAEKRHSGNKDDGAWQEL